MGQGLTIVSPASNRTVTSPVRVAAEFPNTAGIVSTTISVDNVDTPGGNVYPAGRGCTNVSREPLFNRNCGAG